LITAHRDPFPGQVVHDAAATAAGILQVEGIHAGHGPQRRLTHRDGLVIEGRSGQSEQLTLARDAEFWVVVIDQLAQCMGITAAETFFEPLQFHLQPADLLEQLRLFGLAFLFVLCLLASGEQLAGALQQLPLPLAHPDGMDRMISGDLLDRLSATDRLHGDLGLELGAMGAALAHLVGVPFRGGTPPQKLTMEPVQKCQSTSGITALNPTLTCPSRRSCSARQCISSSNGR
jgi:hypothetical protein